MKVTINHPIQLRNAVYYDRFYPWERIGHKLQYRLKVSGRWTQWMDVPEVEAKCSPRLVAKRSVADYKQRYRESRAANLRSGGRDG